MPSTALSDLQQFILALAILHRNNQYYDEGTHPDVFAYEPMVLVSYRLNSAIERGTKPDA
jgi:hypothetical protein